MAVKWEGTVMSDEQIMDARIGEEGKGFHYMPVSYQDRGIAQAQAEITGKIMEQAGKEEAWRLSEATRLDFYRAGIRLVAEWIIAHSYHPYTYSKVNPEGKTPLDRWEPCLDGRLLDELEWQAKLKRWFKNNPELLKEWGIKDVIT